MKIKPTHFADERPELDSYLAEVQANRHPVALLLDGVQNMRNIGAMFRLADAARLEKIYCYDLLEKVNWHKIKRTARSTQQYVPFEELNSLDEIEKLKETHDLVAIEITNTSQSYITFQPTRPTILILGSEQRSVSEAVLQLVDRCVHIPMYGVNTSMNVAVAAGIVTYDVVEKVRAWKGMF